MAITSPTGWAAAYGPDKLLPVQFFTPEGVPMVYDREFDVNKLTAAGLIGGFEYLVECDLPTPPAPARGGIVRE